MVEQAGATISEAVAMASLVPARSLGMDKKLGSLQIGKKADLIRFTPNWEIKGVWIGGEDVKAEI
jgi:N-acetylglucosamine-6-phosphate deacetylase